MIRFKVRESILKENIHKYLRSILLPELSFLIEEYSRECPWDEELLNVYSKKL